MARDDCSALETYALRVLGDSMEPEFADGCVIIIDPGHAPRDGSYVVVEFAGDVFFRRLVFDGERRHHSPKVMRASSSFRRFCSSGSRERESRSAHSKKRFLSCSRCARAQSAALGIGRILLTRAQYPPFRMLSGSPATLPACLEGFPG